MFALYLGIGASNIAAADQPKALQIDCRVLFDAMKNNKVSATFYRDMCSAEPGVTVNNLFSTGATERIIQSIATRSPSMLQIVKEYGDPEKIITLLGQKSLDNQKSLLSSLNWRFYHNLVDYLTSGNINFYIEEFLFSKESQRNTASTNRFTTLFWTALRSYDPFFLKNVLTTRLSPYRLESDPSAAGQFPCAANIYLCVIISAQASPEDKQQILSVLEAHNINAPSWTRKSLWQEFSNYKVRYLSIENAEICSMTRSDDCDFVTKILEQASIENQENGGVYSFTDYAGYDSIGKRHLFTGQAGTDVFAAWLPSSEASGGAQAKRPVEIVSYRLGNGRVVQYKDQIGKRIQYFNRLYQAGFLAFDATQSRYVIRIINRNYL